MARNKIKGIFIDPSANIIKQVEVVQKTKSSCKEFYQLLGCSTIDIAVRQFGCGKIKCDIVLDDEGLLKENNKTAILTCHNGKIIEQLVGKMFICGSNDDGELVSLNAKQIIAIAESIFKQDNGDIILVATY